MISNNTLLYGYGNPGRQDDGLGIKFCNEAEHLCRLNNLPNVTFETNYQLNIEDAKTISSFETVVFIDASTEPIDSFVFTRVEPNDQISFTMHASSPGFILDLCQKIFNKNPETYLLHIKGYEWELKEQLTEGAQKNLQKAIQFVQPVINSNKKISDLFLT